MRAWRGVEEVDLGGPQQRALMALLLVRAGEPVSLSEVVDVLWGADPPDTAVNVVHRHIGVLRRLLEPELPVRSTGRWLVRWAGGYRLDVGIDDVDLLRFRAVRRQASQAADVGQAAVLYADALELWHGACAAGIDADARAHPVFAAVEREFLTTARDAAEAGVRAGQVHRLLPMLRDAAVRAPLDEPLQAGLVLALAAAGQQAEALVVYQRVREQLADELGIDPGTELAAAHAAVLRGDTAPAGAPVGPSEPAHRPRPAQLPAAPATFVGRRTELARGLGMHPGAETSTTVVISAIGGMAGVGKTTLAVHWAHQVADQFSDGQLYVNLRGFSAEADVMRPEQALRGFLDALGVAPQSVPTDVDAQAALYRSLLTGRRMLVLLDNARDVEQVRPLLPGAGGCLAIITSRNTMAGLVAVEGAQSVTLDVLPAEQARDFLGRRVGAERVAAEPAAVEQIISLCAGLPLALAIVAARAVTNPAFPLAATANELREAHGSLEALSGADASISVRATFSWSYRTLSPAAARLFRLLGGHPGPDVGIPAAASLLGVPIRQVRPLLAELTAAHVLMQPSPGRYGFHELLGAYAAELAEAVDTAGELDLAKRRVVEYYLRAAFSADRLLRPQRVVPHFVPRPAVDDVVDELFEDHRAALTWLTTERAVLTALIERTARDGWDAETQYLAWSLDTFLHRQGHWHDWVAARRHALTATEGGAVPAARARAHRELGHALSQVRRLDEARAQFTLALAGFEGADNRTEQGHVQRGIGRTYHWEGRYAEMVRHCELAGDLYQADGNDIGHAKALNEAGVGYALLGDHVTSLENCRTALVIFERLGDRHGQAATLDSIGSAHSGLDDHDIAIGFFTRALQLCREVGDRLGEAVTLTHLGDAWQAKAERPAARDHWLAAEAILVDVGHPDVDGVRAKLAATESPS
ncbi:DNA-binding SARP family transcriptional activator/tetratricopeptide (TPR) repeat protein [Hamadaea flava]|uniref:BTAD domain-containing putative transcriptional regulator n=1 Tax=Hamadaea flava TaxID=1742688 RepID=A0ABV8LV08_9ACTN|nr:BTAD domain-containing putative transcriptional regulator [Hamadaea flava]MCP2329505.1 DNA-binding SARP family transcriptional activator/tetratricopeptide (TPR) repeat protein [Hamadaea flava]